MFLSICFLKMFLCIQDTEDTRFFQLCIIYTLTNIQLYWFFYTIAIDFQFYLRKKTSSVTAEIDDGPHDATTTYITFYILYFMCANIGK